jgi:two-component system chemotaxis sensor kinase CheA
MGEFDDLVGDFLSEANEHLDLMERDLVTLDRNPGDRVALMCIFRSVHTIKGNCGFLGFAKLEALAHAGENLLSRLRDENLKSNPAVTSILLELVDATRNALSQIESAQSDGALDAAALISDLNELRGELGKDSKRETQTASEPKTSSPSALSDPAASAATLPTARAPAPASSESLLTKQGSERPFPADQSSDAQPGSKRDGTSTSTARSDRLSASDISRDASSDPKHATPKQETDLHPAFEIDDEPAERASDLPSKAPRSSSKASSDLLVSSGVYDLQALSSLFDPMGSDHGSPEQQATTTGPALTRDSRRLNELIEETGQRGDNSVRVDTKVLDEIMNLVGELVLTRNQLQKWSAQQPDDEVRQLVAQVHAVTTSLQERVMKTRMQPVERLFSKFIRLSRSLAAEVGKSVRFEFEGGDTELDRSLLEAIRDPLTHILRNAIDHGIETPSRRLALEKPAEGSVRMRASHQDGNVHIEVQDDGHGIDLAAIRAKAVSLGLLPARDADSMPDPASSR